MDALVEAFIRQLPSWTAGGVISLAWFLWRLWIQVHDHVARYERERERDGDRLAHDLAAHRADDALKALEAAHRVERLEDRVERLEDRVETKRK